MAMNDNPDGGSTDANMFAKLSEAISAFRDIDSSLHGEADTLELSVRDLLKLLPEDYVAATDPDQIPDTTVKLTIDDLFYQLSKGKVELTISMLTSFLPAELVTPQALEDDQTMVRLPLQAVVSALDPNLLKERTAVKASRHKAMDMPDPFARKTPEPTPAPPVDTQPPAEEPEAVSPAPEKPPTEVPAPAEVPPLAEDEPDAEITPSTEIEPPVAEETPPEITEIVPPEIPDEEPLPEVIPEPVEEPVPEQPEEPEPVRVEEPPEPVVQEEVPVEPEPVAEVSAAPEPSPAPPEPELQPLYEDVGTFGGVNLNAANAEQLVTLDGVTAAVAEAILSHRRQEGPFKNIFEVQEIPRVGRKTFRKMTGMPYSKARRHRGQKLAKLLDINTSEIGHLPSVAKGLAARSGFSGCIISDEDGMLLAENGASQFAESLSAITPRFIQQMRDNASVLNMGEIDSVSMCIDEHMFTTVVCGRICLTAVHQRNKVTKGQLTRVRKVAAELAWLLSHRAYVGRPEDA